MYSPFSASVRGRLLAGALLFLVAAGAPMTSMALGSVPFVRDGPFETCLDEAFAAWVQTQAELMVNEDPRAQSLDDAAVAMWALSALESCRRNSGPVYGPSEDIFTRFMSRWREHVFELASSIRRRGQSD